MTPAPSDLILLRARAADVLIGVMGASTLDLPGAADGPLPTELVWMPAGTNRITAFGPGGKPWTGEVTADAQGAAAVEAMRAESERQGRRVYLDENHQDSAATAWVQGFRWDPARGIIADVVWTAHGEALLRGRVYYSFSPAFLVNKQTGRVAGIPLGHAAGGLVNAPAFGAAMPALIAARHFPLLESADGGDDTNTTKSNTMPREVMLKILAAVGVSAPADATDEQLTTLVAKHADALSAKQAVTADATETEEVQAKLAELATLQARDAARRKADAKQAVDAAVARGALAPKAETVLASWREMIEADPSKAELLAALPGNPALQRVTAAGAPATARDGTLETLRAMQAETDPQRRGLIYRDVRDFIAAHSGEVLPLLAANSLGTLAGDLIVQRALDLLKLSFPVLGAITTDFSAEQARQGQAIKTRVIGVPSVVALNDTTGWASSDATATDVTVTIGQPKGVQIEYGSTEIAKTNRNLFDEQVQASHYALAKDLVDALYALIVIGTFTNATTKATGSLARVDLVAMEKALAARGAEGIRHLLLNADTYERMSNDTTLLNLATQQRAEMITGTGLPPIAGFNVIRAINLPATGNLTGFGFRRDALVVATRLPEDYTRALPGAAHGNVSVVTNMDTGISVQKVDFVDHKLAKAVSRIAWAYGVAAGNPLAGQILKSA